jgi:hypothetical protein
MTSRRTRMDSNHGESARTAAHRPLLRSVCACGVIAVAASCSQDSDRKTGGQSTELSPSAPASVASSSLPNYFVGILYSDVTDNEPTTVRVTSSAGSAECLVLFPGIGPWTSQQAEAQCARSFLAPDLTFWATVSYPSGDYPAREGDPVPPPEPGPPQGTCDSDSCSAPGTPALPLPDFPHVRLDVTVGLGITEALLEVVGNGRDFQRPIPERQLPEISAYRYVNVDAPPDSL